MSETIVVPREPTPAMIRAAQAALGMPWSAVIPPSEDGAAFVMRMVWAAMLEAAPGEPTP